MEKEEIVKYWIDGANDDRETALGLYKLGRYHWCLFIWQLVIEKLLKAQIVNKGKEVPPIHNLIRLSQEAEVELDKEKIESLEEITGFNLEARYDDYKRSFYRKADKNYTDIWTNKCEELYIWIKKHINTK